MSRPSLSTPCPAPLRPSSTSSSSSIASSYPIPDDTTANIEYTRAFPSRPSLQGAKPRRRSSLLAGNTHALRKVAQPITIFEDVQEDEVLYISETQPKVISGKTLLCKPARKIAPVAAATTRQTARQHVGSVRQQPTSSQQQQVRRGLSEMRQGSNLSSAPSPDFQTGSMAPRITAGGSVVEANAPTADKGTIKKAARRKTIFVPEDTTVMTIHPGAENTAKIDDTFNLTSLGGPSRPSENIDVVQSDLAKPMRRPRKSLAVAPRRMSFMPLENMGNTEAFDLCGDNTGKENVPPGGYVKFKEAASTSPEARSQRDSRLANPTAASTARVVNAPRNSVPLSRALAPRSRNAPRASFLAPPVQQSKAIPRLSADDMRSRNMTRATRTWGKQELQKAAAFKRASLMMLDEVKKFEPLPSSLSRMSLYDDDWLGHQEVSLTEIINIIFTMSPKQPITPTNNTRDMLIAIYNQSEVEQIFMRLQASLTHGALKCPSSKVGSLSLAHDIGLRKKFISLWLDTYEEELLRAAAEVVVGRMVPRRASTENMNLATERLLDPGADRRSLISFLETFFVRVGDVKLAAPPIHGDSEELDHARWVKMMKRSLMLVWLLDQAKESGVFPGNLFKSTSAHKSSASFVRELSTLLLPSTGDITRVLKQMEFEVVHVQDVLDEVKYQVNNLAVDLVDGVFLVHLVELLLYARKREDLEVGDETITIALPDETILESNALLPDLTYNPHMLSQHLKIPCITRAQKIYNVQLALSALESHSVTGANVVGAITAEDIVNGHRERTLSLLWSLLCVYGLNKLIKWKELVADIKRVDTKTLHTLPVDLDSKAMSKQSQQKLLMKWADTHAAKAGLPSTNNLNTAFSNGKIYVAILDGFSCFVPELSSDGSFATNSPRKINSVLEKQLKALGCSVAFTKKLTSSIGEIPSDDVTMSNLAFLASKLLPISVHFYTAVFIQRWYRKQRGRAGLSSRILHMKAGRECAEAAEKRNHEVEAVMVVQRAWRAVLAKRIELLEGDVVHFQSLARGFLGRGRPSLKMVGEVRGLGRCW